MKTLLLSFVFASIIFLLIDIIWLSITIKYFYKPNIGPLLNEKPILWAAILFYFVYTVGLTLVVLRPALIEQSVLQAFWMGAVFGLVAYGTYNLTNMATVKNWSVNVVFVDMIWGGVLTSVSSGLSIFITKHITSLN